MGQLQPLTDQHINFRVVTDAIFGAQVALFATELGPARPPSSSTSTTSATNQAGTAFSMTPGSSRQPETAPKLCLRAVEYVESRSLALGLRDGGFYYCHAVNEWRLGASLKELFQ